MLKLINIRKNNDIIEADYIPEDSNDSAHVSVNIITKEETGELVEGYSGAYRRHAFNGLERIIEELEKGEITEFPKEYLVMWY